MSLHAENVRALHSPTVPLLQLVRFSYQIASPSSLGDVNNCAYQGDVCEQVDGLVVLPSHTALQQSPKGHMVEVGEKREMLNQLEWQTNPTQQADSIFPTDKHRHKAVAGLRQAPMVVYRENAAFTPNLDSLQFCCSCLYPCHLLPCIHSATLR